MSAAAVASFVSRIAKHFPPQKFASEAEEAEWLASIVESLKKYDDDLLARAAQRIIDTRGLREGERWFPVPAAIRKVCDALIAEDYRENTLPTIAAALLQPVQHVHKRALALDLLRTQQGREAAADGWVLALYEFCAEQGRAPTNQERHSFKTLEKGLDGRVRWNTHRCTEVEWLRMSAKGAQEAHEASIKGGFPFAAAWARMGDERAARRERLAQHALGQIDLRGRAEI